MLVVTCDNCCNLSRFCQELTGLFSYRKVEPNGLTLFCFGWVIRTAERRRGGGCPVLSCADTLSAASREMFSPLGLFSPFFQPIHENPSCPLDLKQYLFADRGVGYSRGLHAALTDSGGWTPRIYQLKIRFHLLKHILLRSVKIASFGIVSGDCKWQGREDGKRYRMEIQRAFQKTWN